MAKRQERITTFVVAYTVFALDTFFLNNEAGAQEEIDTLESTKNEKETSEQTTGGYDFLGILAVPVATAIIGAIAASWDLFRPDGVDIIL